MIMIKGVKWQIDREWSQECIWGIILIMLTEVGRATEMAQALKACSVPEEKWSLVSFSATGSSQLPLLSSP